MAPHPSRSLREPLEEGSVSIARAKGTEHFPAQFVLVAAMNPCPCGFHGDKTKACECPPGALQKYQRKISGPILDRIDMMIEVPRLAHEKLSGKQKDGGAYAKKAMEKILSARAHQQKRFAGGTHPERLNGHMSVRDLDRLVPLSESVKKKLNEVATIASSNSRARLPTSTNRDLLKKNTFLKRSNIGQKNYSPNRKVPHASFRRK